ncbi:uncharacterized protein LOC114336691 isoform X1 [Diabrotica virgifera virgifera]|uniref:4-coumarate--CoA ligase 1-like n=1 Tax=Diabrotica virgifera virgifera TaxID=50390 RepID=A0ABM5KUU6_DIAVI|nr:uncharacterized protein LOC114336691 isoform X1 [Diabrotica virgifera virgifera]
MSVKVFKNILNNKKNILSATKYVSVYTRKLGTSDGQSKILTCGTTVDIPNVSIPEFVYPSLDKFHKYTAMVCATTGRSYTFGEVKKKSKTLSRALRHIFKLKKGDVVAIFSPNKAEYAIAIFGILDAGLTVTTLNPIYTPAEVARQLQDSSAKVIITQTPSIPTVKASLDLLKTTIPIVAIKSTQNESLPSGIIDFDELLNTNLDVPDVDVLPSDLAILPYSSGTTGLPKGVELTHSNIVSNLCQMKHDDYNYQEAPTDSYQDVTAGILPFFHIYGLTMTLFTTINNGVKTIAIEKFTPDLYVSVLKNFPISLIYAAPPLVLFLTSSPLVKSEYFKNLKLLTCGAAPLGFSDEQRFLEKAQNPKTKIVQGYGMTETSPILTYYSKYIPRNEANGGTIGTVVPNTLLKIVAPGDTTGAPLGPNEKGELLAKGPQIMKRYFNRAEETESAFLDGWLKTGDIAYYNQDECLFITDRIKELIKVKGFQVVPAELEEVIRGHPEVEDAAVIGIPHEQYGEVPRAYIVVKKNKNISGDEIKSYVAQQVANYKRLVGGVSVVDAIPRNPSGKILRRQLKLEFAEKGH